MILATLLWATSIPAGKLGIAVLPVSEVLVFRFGLGALVLWIFLAFTRRHFTFYAASRAFGYGFMAPALATMMAYWALYLTSAVHVVIINSMMPLLSALFAWRLLRERTSLPVLIGAVLAVIGVLVLATVKPPGQDASIWGDLMVVGCNILACLAMVGLRHLSQTHSDILSITAWQLSGATVCSLLVMIFIESWADPRGWTAVEDTDTWILIFYLSVFLTALPFGLNNYALRGLTAFPLGCKVQTPRS